MASKRHVEPLDPVIFTKLPRLERDPAASFPRGLCKPSPGSENRFNYKGSYFAYALQSPDGPEPPRARRSPRCPPYPPESLGPGLKRPPGAEKGKDRLVSELVMTREKWGGLGPHHPFPVKKPVAVNPLAVPKPVYRAPEYFMDSRVALPLQQRPGNADWALPTASPASHPFHPGEHRRGPHADPSLPQLHPSMALPAREKVGSPVGFSPYYTVFEQYRSPPAHPFLDTSPHSQRKAPEMSRLSPDPWHKLRPPATSPVYQERPPECYLQSHYPLPLHKAPLFYPPSAPHMEAQPSGAYRGFGFAGSREPYPGTYLKPQAPRSYFPNPSDTYMSRAASAGAVASPPPKPAALPRDAEPPRQAGYVPSSSFAFSPGGMDVSSTSRARMEPGCEQHQAEGSRQPVVVRHSSAFQPICTQEKVPGGSSGLTETFPKGKGGGSNGIPEAFPKGEAGSSCGITKTFPKGEGRWVNQDPPEQKPPNPERRAGSAPRKTPSEGPPALIAIGKGDTCKVKDAAKELISLSPPASPPELLEDPRDSEVPPPSPPMPVIKKVFSLASCGDYLEGTEGSASFCREHLWGDTPPLNMGGSQDKVLDLSLKKRLVEPGETRRVLDGQGAKEEKKDPERTVRAGEETKPRGLPLLVKVASLDRNSFQSSASFLFTKYKILRSTPAPPSTIPPLFSTIPTPASTIPAPPSTIPAPSTPPPAPCSSTPPASPQPGPLAPPPLPEPPCALLGEERVSLPGPCAGPAPHASAGQYFTTLHTWLCDVLSCSVARSSPELLREWLKKATKGKEIWLAFQDVAALLANLLSQLETFMFARKCPFPHVVRAGAVFIPIHVVKEKLFPKLPGVSVDQVLQEHKVELRPTTLSEERHLRDLELKSCTSRMLKLLALKQLPDIYPDLLNLHCISLGGLGTPVGPWDSSWEVPAPSASQMLLFGGSIHCLRCPSASVSSQGFCGAFVPCEGAKALAQTSPREAVAAPSLAVFKARLDTGAWSNLL
uniref:Uncharacterized protein n=1 Tax=Strigops habroptila TaxID=2489341 RepID=A0A672V1W1_STRHB